MDGIEEYQSTNGRMRFGTPLPVRPPFLISTFQCRFMHGGGVLILQLHLPTLHTCGCRSAQLHAVCARMHACMHACASLCVSKNEEEEKEEVGEEGVGGGGVKCVCVCAGGGGRWGGGGGCAARSNSATSVHYN